MAEDNWNDESGIDDEKARQFTAGFTKPWSIADAFRSAWLNLKTGLGIEEEEKKPRQSQEE
jgi:hypothetical protein